MKPTVKKALRIISLIIAAGILGFIGYLSWRFALNREEFKAYMDSAGIWGYLIYPCIVMLQIVVAVVPAGPLQMAGGYAFGTVLGTILFVIGATLGSIIVFVLVHHFGKPIVDIFFKDKDIQKLKFLQDDKKRNLLFLILFVIPGSPKDLLCYVAALTDMKLWFFLLVVSLGRLPAAIGTIISGQAISNSNFKIAIIALACVLILSLIGLAIYLSILKKKKKNDE